MKTIETYYFKFIVPSHYAMEFNTFKQAQKVAKKLNEKIYLTIFSKGNLYNEPYDEKIVTCEGEVNDLKDQMIGDFLMFINK